MIRIYVLFSFGVITKAFRGALWKNLAGIRAMQHARIPSQMGTHSYSQNLATTNFLFVFFK